MPPDSSKKSGTGRSPDVRQDVIELLMNIDSELLCPVDHLEGRDRYYFMLRTAKGKGIDGLESAEIEFILKKRLMIKGTHKSNIRRDLRGSKELVERFPFGRGYVYKVTKVGEEHLRKKQRETAPKD